MRRTPSHNPSVVKRAQIAADAATDLHELRRAQAVLLPALLVPIRAALAERLGQPVKASVVYRMLARHDWRKVAPDTRHPKSNLATQQEWKKLPDALAALLIPE